MNTVTYLFYAKTQYPNRHAKLDKPDQSDYSTQLRRSTIVPGQCLGCSKKMLEMLDAEISYWQYSDTIPSLKDLKNLEKIGKRTYKILKRNQLLP